MDDRVSEQRPPAPAGSPHRGSVEEWLDAAIVAAGRGETVAIPARYALSVLQAARDVTPSTAAERAALDVFERYVKGQRAESLFWSDRDREQYGPGLDAMFVVLEMARRAIGGADAE